MTRIVLNKNEGTLRLIKKDSSINLVRKNNTIRFSTTGRKGPRGDGDKYYTQSFTNSADVTIPHGLGKRPSISIEDSAGDEVEGQVTYIDLDTMRVRFSASFTGKVFCN